MNLTYSKKDTDRNKRSMNHVVLLFTLLLLSWFPLSASASQVLHRQAQENKHIHRKRLVRRRTVAESSYSDHQDPEGYKERVLPKLRISEDSLLVNSKKKDRHQSLASVSRHLKKKKTSSDRKSSERIGEVANDTGENEAEYQVNLRSDGNNTDVVDLLFTTTSSSSSGATSTTSESVSKSTKCRKHKYHKKHHFTTTSSSSSSFSLDSIPDFGHNLTNNIENVTHYYYHKKKHHHYSYHVYNGTNTTYTYSHCKYHCHRRRHPKTTSSSDSDSIDTAPNTSKSSKAEFVFNVTKRSGKHNYTRTYVYHCHSHCHYHDYDCSDSESGSVYDDDYDYVYDDDFSGNLTQVFEHFEKLDNSSTVLFFPEEEDDDGDISDAPNGIPDDDLAYAGILFSNEFEDQDFIGKFGL